MMTARILQSVRDPGSAIPDFAALHTGTLGLRLSNPGGPRNKNRRLLSETAHFVVRVHQDSNLEPQFWRPMFYH